MRGQLLRVVAATAMVAGAGAGAAARPAGGDGNSLVAIGLGPAAEVSGPLAERVRGAGLVSRVRLGGRFGALGCDLVIGTAGLDHDELDSPSMWLVTPTLAYYPVHGPWFLLGARAGLGFGALSGERQVPKTTCGEYGCSTADQTITVRQSSFAADLGVTAQLHLGRRRGGRAVLWLDAGVSFVRVGFDDRVVGGRIVQLTMGIGHGMSL